MLVDIKDILAERIVDADEDIKTYEKEIEELKELEEYYQRIVDAILVAKNNPRVEYDMKNYMAITSKPKPLSAKLIETEREIASEISHNYLGKVVEVLVEGVHPKKKGYLMGSTDFGKTISFAGEEKLLGSFVSVKVEKANHTTLTGTIVEILQCSNSTYNMPTDKIRRK